MGKGNLCMSVTRQHEELCYSYTQAADFQSGLFASGLEQTFNTYPKRDQLVPKWKYNHYDIHFLQLLPLRELPVP